MAEEGPIMILSSFSQLSEAKYQDDDWTGLKDSAERRKRQNRLNVRAHRRRKAALQAAHTFAQPSNRNMSCRNESWQYGTGTDYKIRTPIYNSNMLFPLSRDHLIPLVKYNILRASLTNVGILSLFNLIPASLRDRYHSIPLFDTPGKIPECLRPTALQRTVQHDPRLDLWPDPKLRDSILTNLDKIDFDQLTRDTFGLPHDDCPETDLTGVVAWSNPWHISGWEMTEPFVRKWAFLLQGCKEAMDWTNKWRATRGEEPLAL